MLLDLLKRFLQQHGDKRTYWIAYSGGLDSHVLLSLCNELCKESLLHFRAIHINHHLSPYSKLWAQHCEKISADMGIPFIEKNIQINLKKGDSLEELARDRRYAEFAACLSEGDTLLTAHHQDDQAETMLLQLLRGAGPKGLAAMPALKPFARGWHARPLLEVDRATLLHYAETHSLKWIEDESNDNVKLTRNFIRHDILPKFKTRWPSVVQSISRSARHCAESQVLLEEFALDILKNFKGSTTKTLSVNSLLALDAAKQRLILRTWIHAEGYLLPDTKKIETVRRTVLMAGHDRMPCVRWENVELRRHRDDLYLMPKLSEHDASLVLHWNINEPLTVAGIGTLSTRLLAGKGLKKNIENISIRFRQGGEMLRMRGRRRRTLKNLFQEWNIPTWERDRVPLLFVDDQCIGVVGYCIDKDFQAKQDEMGLEPHLEKQEFRHPGK